MRLTSKPPQNPGAIHAACEDYRAASTIDLEHDTRGMSGRADGLPCSMLPALWGARGNRRQGVRCSGRRGAIKSASQVSREGSLLRGILFLRRLPRKRLPSSCNSCERSANRCPLHTSAKLALPIRRAQWHNDQAALTFLSMARAFRVAGRAHGQGRGRRVPGHRAGLSVVRQAHRA